MLFLALQLLFAAPPQAHGLEARTAPEMIAIEVVDEMGQPEKVAKEERRGEEPIELLEMPLEDVSFAERGLHFLSPAGALETILGSPGANFDPHLHEAGFTHKIADVPLGIMDLMLSPVREANLLLPKRLDPFSTTGDDPILPGILSDRPPEKEADSFSVEEQAKILGNQKLGPTGLTAEGQKWKWQVEAGGLFRQGNTAANNLNAQLQADRLSTTSHFQSKFGAVYNNNGVDRPNRRFFGLLQLDRNLRGRWLAYCREEVDSDRAALVRIRSVTSTGLGFKFINEVDKLWIARTGPSFSYALFEDQPETSTPSGGWFLESDFRRRIWEGSRFEWITTMFPDFSAEQQLRIRTDLALLFPIGGKTSKWNWKIGARHFYQLDPVPGALPNDVEVYFTVLYTK